MSTLAQDLALLEARGLMRVTMDQSRPVVRFKHALTRQATYNSILQARRSELHCAVAHTLTQFHKHPDLELVLSIAEHQLHCGDDAGMLEFLLPFAQQLIYTGRSTSLTHLLARLDRAALNGTQQRDLDMALADAHAARGEYEAARALYERALARVDTPSLRARTLHSLGAAEYHLGNYQKALARHREGLGLSQQLGDIALQARASGGLGLAYLWLGEMQDAELQFQHSRQLGLQLGDGATRYRQSATRILCFSSPRARRIASLTRMRCWQMWRAPWRRCKMAPSRIRRLHSCSALPRLPTLR